MKKNDMFITPVAQLKSSAYLFIEHITRDDITLADFSVHTIINLSLNSLKVTLLFSENNTAKHVWV